MEEPHLDFLGDEEKSMRRDATFALRHSSRPRVQLARGLQPRPKIAIRTCASRNDLIDGIMFAMEEMVSGVICKVLATPDVWRLRRRVERHSPEMPRAREGTLEACPSGRITITGREEVCARHGGT